MGILYVVSTPIGNMGDISERGLETLKKVDLILAEDTRRSARLLKHYNIQTPMTSFHEHNEETKIAEVILKLKENTNIAQITDAGTPLISDPGFKLIRECTREEIKIVPVPGASAVISALITSGLPTDSFCFLGYVPKKEGKRKIFFTKIQQLTTDIKATVVFFETPHRIEKTLLELADIFPDSNLSLAREMTKLNEEIITGSVSDIIKKLENRKLKGEITLVLR